MKQCPTCNRTYRDDTLAFCLDDGTLLVTSFDPEATRVINPPPRDVVSPTHNTLVTPTPSHRANPGVYVAIALLALLVGGALVWLLKSSENKEIPTPTSQTSNPSVNPNVTSNMPKQQSTPIPEKHEWTVVVPGNVRWLDTGIHAQKGMRLAIHATGNITWGPPLGNASNVVGPNGTRPPFPQDASPFPIPNAGIGSLVMRIGSVKYAVGADDNIEVKEAGTVELMVNDDAVGDNSGSFTVHISS